MAFEITGSGDEYHVREPSTGRNWIATGVPANTVIRRNGRKKIDERGFLFKEIEAEIIKHMNKSHQGKR